jgi:hypothetical protein
MRGGRRGRGSRRGRVFPRGGVRAVGEQRVACFWRVLGGGRSGALGRGQRLRAGRRAVGSVLVRWRAGAGAAGALRFFSTSFGRKAKTGDVRFFFEKWPGVSVACVCGSGWLFSGARRRRFGSGPWAAGVSGPDRRWFSAAGAAARWRRGARFPEGIAGLRRRVALRVLRIVGEAKTKRWDNRTFFVFVRFGERRGKVLAAAVRPRIARRASRVGGRQAAVGCDARRFATRCGGGGGAADRPLSARRAGRVRGVYAAFPAVTPGAGSGAAWPRHGRRGRGRPVAWMPPRHCEGAGNRSGAAGRGGSKEAGSPPARAAWMPSVGTRFAGEDRTRSPAAKGGTSLATGVRARQEADYCVGGTTGNSLRCRVRRHGCRSSGFRRSGGTALRPAVMPPDLGGLIRRNTVATPCRGGPLLSAAQSGPFPGGGAGGCGGVRSSEAPARVVFPELATETLRLMASALGWGICVWEVPEGNPSGIACLRN